MPRAVFVKLFRFVGAGRGVHRRSRWDFHWFRVLTSDIAPVRARIAPAHRRSVWDWRATRRVRLLLEGWHPSTNDALFRRMETVAWLAELESDACPHVEPGRGELRVDIVSRVA